VTGVQTCALPICLVLSHSRKAYSEVFFRQTTDNLLACWENAFAAWGGVPRTLVIDNLKAAVLHADWYDPELHPKVSAFCKHYGTVLLPTKPRMPRHKGKIEAGIKFVQSNALRGRSFDSLAAQNAHLAHWESCVADVRIHGTTKKQVRQVFEQFERPALLALPADRFPFFHEAQRVVHRDGHVEVDKAYYSVPPEYSAAEQPDPSSGSSQSLLFRFCQDLVKGAARPFEGLGVTIPLRDEL
jgi:hypothetical protein